MTCRTPPYLTSSVDLQVTPVFEARAANARDGAEPTPAGDMVNSSISAEIVELRGMECHATCWDLELMRLNGHSSFKHQQFY